MSQNLKDKPDEELMVLYIEGSDEAFSVLYRRYSGKVYGFLKNRLKNPGQAEDVLQSTFMKLHKSREQFDPKLKFSAWIFTICRTSMLDSMRKSGSEPELFSEKDLEQLAGATEPEAVSGKSAVDLSTLPAQQRAAVELRYQEDLDFEEIAERLKTSPANVRQLISRGIKKLRSITARDGGLDDQ